MPMDTYLNYANASPAQFGATFGGSYFNPLEGQSSNILDSIIGRRMENVEPMRAKIRKFYEQEQIRKQQEELENEKQKQKTIAETAKGIEVGVGMLSKPVAKDSQDIGGQNKGQQAAQEGGRQVALAEAGENLSEADKSFKSAEISAEKAIESQDEGAYKNAVGILPSLSKGAMSAYNLYNKVESGTATPEDYVRLGVSATGLTGSVMKGIGEKGSSLYSVGGTMGNTAGALGGGIGLYEGISGIANNPNDPSNYIKTATSGVQTYQGINNIINPPSTTAPSGVGSSPTLSALQGVAGAYNISQGSRNPVDYMAAGGAALQAAGAGLSAAGATGAGAAASAAGSSLGSATPWGAIGAAVHGTGEHLEKHNPEGSFTGRLGRGLAGGIGDFLSTNDKTSGAIAAIAPDPTHSVHEALDKGFAGDYEGGMKSWLVEPFTDLFGDLF